MQSSGGNLDCTKDLFVLSCGGCATWKRIEPAFRLALQKSYSRLTILNKKIGVKFKKTLLSEAMR
jgi:hypothetical protein